MAKTAEQLVEKSRTQRKRALREQALASAIEATEISPSSADAWWEVALNTRDLHGPKAALPALRRTAQLAPHFAYAWTLLGQTLKAVDKPKSARICFERALRSDPDEYNALLELAEIYRVANDEEAELNALSSLDRRNLLDAWRLKRVGILHHNKKDFYRAIDYFKRAAALSHSPDGLSYLGLAYSEISQDADAIDCWRRCSERYPDYKWAHEAVSKAVPRMVALAAQLRERNPALLDRDEWYCHYINPLELLNVPRGFADTLSVPKALQRLRKALLSEIELEEGRIEWMPGLRIDRSRAIGLCEELSAHTTLALYHTHVFEDPALLRFLSRGDPSHFMVHERDSPIGMIELLESPPQGFQDWLDDVFAKQFNLVFSKAIEKREMLAVEVLLDGRRWVSLDAADRCFESAFRQVDRMLDPLRQYAGAAPRSKPSVMHVQKVLADGNLGTLLSLLPLDFHEIQDEAIGLLRSIAVASYNVHGDADLAQGIVQLCLKLPFKSAVLKHKLHDDMQHLTELIKEECKDEIRLNVGPEPFEITRAGARRGRSFIPTETVDSLRWGTVVTRNGHALVYDFSLTIAGGGAVVGISWTSSNDVEAQKATFGRISQAAIRYLLPSAIERFRRRLTAGERLRVGNVTATSDGVEFATQGWIFSKTVSIPWQHLTTAFGDGDLIIGDSRLAAPQARLPVHSTDNAVLVPFVASALRGE